ncbi:hypothetical protein SAMN02927921_01604 [Sinomicrobium oceani]|uniref:Uncharacterized protein n=1 Tax=Sinomicrobium oceani TaxID=1150368 RepID=A0A1K1P3S7_9FLAO|nr:hypothetical protein SAMN02927921_01604 [Sinomicrobium oceani]
MRVRITTSGISGRKIVTDIKKVLFGKADIVSCRAMQINQEYANKIIEQ